MALFHLRQPKSCLQICRLRFLASRVRICYSICSVGEIDDPPPLEKEEAVAEETRVTAAEPIVEECLLLLSSSTSEEKTGLPSMATLIKHASYGSSNKPKTLTELFGKQNDTPTANIAENKVAKTQESLWEVVSDYAKCMTTESESISHSNDFSSSESENEYSEDFPSDAHANDLPEESEDVTPSDGVQEMLDLKDHNVKSAYDGTAEEDIVGRRSHSFNDQRPLQLSDEPRKEDTRNGSNLEDLLGFLKDMVVTTPNGGNDGSPVKDDNLNVNLSRYDKNDILKSRDIHGGSSWIEEEETNDLEFKSIDCSEMKDDVEISVSTSKQKKKKSKRKNSAKKDEDENKVAVAFLRGIPTESSISHAFQFCGEIVKVELPYVEEEHLFKTAHIYFKTREGYDRALRNSGVKVNGFTAIVGSANSTENWIPQIPIPSLIGDPDIPTALVKNPTRTIKMEPLTNEISSHHIEGALAFCESNISGYFLGSSSSVAYVEFETEIGKERALAKQSINILGKNLKLLRIDNPRTTIVRISNFESVDTKKVTSLCKQLGAHQSRHRSRDILDAHFTIADWPNMSKILNRLNGFEVDGVRLKAEPAPLLPPDILLALWHQQQERKHLKATFRSLLRKLGENGLDTSVLASLENVYVDKL